MILPIEGAPIRAVFNAIWGMERSTLSERLHIQSWTCMNFEALDKKVIPLGTGMKPLSMQWAINAVTGKKAGAT